MRNIFIIGKMGSGKDTLAELLVKHFNFRQVSIAGRLKTIAELLYADVFAGNDRNQKRAILQKLGDLLRSQNINILNDALMREIKVKNMEPVVISDVRYSMEYDYFTSQDFIPVRINIDDKVRFDRLLMRDGTYPSLETLNHKSENDICVSTNRPFIEVNNNGSVEDLEKEAIELVMSRIITYEKAMGMAESPIPAYERAAVN
ncbi:MAG TPA: AAA family ATPase [Candidatus Wallbacteria bacterium]|nr:AAA family ATPase [Candidatus Wallbacteria bacterium]